MEQNLCLCIWVTAKMTTPNVKTPKYTDNFFLPTTTILDWLCAIISYTNGMDIQGSTFQGIISK